jgi:hypothetical protein
MRVHFSRLGPRWRWLLLLPAFFCISCSSGPSYNPVEGQVLYKGQPIDGVGVIFRPANPDMRTIPTEGVTDENGMFKLTTGKAEGAPTGTYTVTFTKSRLVASGKKVMSTEPPEYEDQFKGAYADPVKSKFKIDIKNGPNKLEPFKLD